MKPGIFCYVECGILKNSVALVMRSKLAHVSLFSDLDASTALPESEVGVR